MNYSSSLSYSQTVPVSYFQTTPPDVLDFLPNPPKAPAPLEFWPKKKFLALPILFVLLCALGTLQFWDSSQLHGLWVSQERLVNGEWWRVVTSVFGHADLSHWAMNSMAVLFFAWILGGYYGFLAFPILPLLAGILGNSLAILTYAPQVRLLGASGMVFGMYGLWLVYFLKHHGNLSFQTRFARVFIFAAFMILPSQSKENVSHMAHFAGLGSGILLGLASMNFVKLHEENLSGLAAAWKRYKARYNSWRTKTETIRNQLGDE